MCLQEDIKFKAGKPQTVTVRDVASAMEDEIVGELATVTRQLRAASIEACSGVGGPPPDAGPALGNTSVCGVAAVVNSIQAELDSVTSLGKAPSCCVDPGAHDSCLSLLGLP